MVVSKCTNMYQHLPILFNSSPTSIRDMDSGKTHLHAVRQGTQDRGLGITLPSGTVEALSLMRAASQLSPCQVGSFVT